MRRLGLLIPALALLSGCEGLNETLVRQLFRDSGLSNRVYYQIREGLERREAAPPARLPQNPAGDFPDQGEK